MTTHHPRSITGPVMIGARFVLSEPGSLLEMPQLRRLRLEAVIVEDLDYSPILKLPSMRSLWVMKTRGMRPAFDDLVASTPWDAYDA
jgi:hypothetical protein